MQNPQSEIRLSGQLIPPAALLRRSRPQPATTRPGTGLPGGRTTEPSNLLAHDARNLISALHLYCELLASPGVLSPTFAHYADDLNRLAESGARLIAALAEGRPEPSLKTSDSKTGLEDEATVANYLRVRRHHFPAIEDLGAELAALEQPLRALAGHEIRLEIECMPCHGRLALNSEDLLRILFNLVANAVEALASTPAELRHQPSLRITVQRGGAASFLSHPDGPGAETVVLSVRDNGPGIAAHDLPRIFSNGFSTRPTGRASRGNREEAPRGLGLAIVHYLVSAAGGAVRADSPRGLGARFDIELPVLSSETDRGRSGTALRQENERAKKKLPHLQKFSAQIEKEA